MPEVFFSGTKAGTGGALFVTFNSKDQAAFMRVIKQTGWDEKISKPTFAGGASYNIKLSKDEIAEIIHAVAGHDTIKPFYHEFKGEVTTLSFSYYEKEFTNKAGKLVKSRGFGMTTKKGDVEVKFGFSLGAGERLKQHLEFALDHMNSAIYQQDKKEFEEYLKKKDAAAQAPKPSVKAPEQPTPEVVVDESENPPEMEEDNVVF